MRNKQKANLLLASAVLLGTIATVAETVPAHASSYSSIVGFQNQSGKFILKTDSKTKTSQYFVVINNKEYKLDSSAQRYISKFGLNKTLTLGGQIESPVNTAKVFSASSGNVTLFEFGDTGQFIKVSNNYYFVTPNYYGQSMFSVSNPQIAILDKYLNQLRNVKGFVTETDGITVNRNLEISLVDSQIITPQVSSYTGKGTFKTKTMVVVDVKTAKYVTVTKYLFSTSGFDYEITKNGQDLLKKYGTKNTYTVSGKLTSTPNNVTIDINQVK